MIFWGKGNNDVTGNRAIEFEQKETFVKNTFKEGERERTPERELQRERERTPEIEAPERERAPERARERENSRERDRESSRNFGQFWVAESEFRYSFVGRGAVFEIWVKMLPYLKGNVFLLRFGLCDFKSICLFIEHCLWLYQAHQRCYFGLGSLQAVWG